ncbi:succinate dehydrogenase, cytochrome b556 subunit [Amycolatopsis antarctica]|uniref:Succinate dehydrogenase, cytochrome b556 subunit n=1 Tax=Amycolatopsis antarctica TaxID=1854586 RepID=A0A263D9E4_9PSEU|nr:succinate dehydrogenase, cytochrome b556 subunit [Amycolatopsis antarctica]OZM75001.1 succinate dehydrogenase, cytochrome b556 subunit [Amycolatopsis antarctica]
MSTTASTAEATAGSDRAGASRRNGTFYRGDPGMWSWVMHRITGVLTFFFLFVHVLDTALVRVSPESYDAVIETYKTPFVNLLEVALVGAVLYHALNGIRVMLVDFWSKGPALQRPMLWTILGVWVLVMIPGTYFMLERTITEMFGG